MFSNHVNFMILLLLANFDIKDLSPIDHADKCYIPALFVAAENDNFVAPHHRYCIFIYNIFLKFQ